MYAKNMLFFSLPSLMRVVWAEGGRGKKCFSLPVGLFGYE